MRTYKYRLYPTRKQQETLQWTLDRARELYNAALQERRDTWAIIKHHPNFYDEEWRKQAIKDHGRSCYRQINELPDVKEVRDEYNDIYSQVLQETLKRVDKAYKAFFRRVQNGEKAGYPRYQGRDRYHSFCYPQSGFSLEGNRLVLSKIGHLKIKVHRPVQGTIKTCTIKREGDCWYVCFACEIEATLEKHTPYTDEAVGIDLGLCHFAALSTGDIIENPRFFRQAEKKITGMQQELARKKRGSKRRKKTVKRLSKAYRKVRNQRQDFLHQWSRCLVNTYETIVFEDLAPSKMSKAPKPKQEKETGVYLPNGASKKAGLNTSILDAGWSTFMNLCEYKAACAGVVQVKKVDPYKTSQVCSGCLHEGPHKDLSERVHTCENCGLVLDRDINAAMNILAVWNGLNLRPTPKTTKKKTQARTEPSEDAPLRSPRL
ncbi:transposase [Dictyobacter aurantiacus]|uniref:Transposase n=2 Tax=Dictyobacter aurantiacus TaxID=1936993 RepID=A0A401ZSD5_9CHLR|nr:transposase [Dictyobacter aurantiacus]